MLLSCRGTAYESRLDETTPYDFLQHLAVLGRHIPKRSSLLVGFHSGAHVDCPFEPSQPAGPRQTRMTGQVWGSSSRCDFSSLAVRDHITPPSHHSSPLPAPRSDSLDPLPGAKTPNSPGRLDSVPEALAHRADIDDGQLCREVLPALHRGSIWWCSVGGRRGGGCLR